MKDKSASDPLAAEAASMDTPLGRLDELAHQPRLIPIVAANPATSAETLEKLAKSNDEAICRAVAHNPNTPVAVLLRLAQRFPQEFLSNPVLPLLNLSQPDFIKKLDGSAWLHLLRSDRVPSVWLKWLQQGVILPINWQQKTILEEIQFHVAVAGDVTSGWEKEANRALQADRRLLDYLRRVNPQILLLCILAFPDLAAQWGIELRSTRKEVLRVVLEHSPALSGNTLAFLAREQEPAIRCAVARHPRTPGKVLKKLADTHADPAVRRAVASNPHLSIKLLRRLAGDSEAAVRIAVAHHPHAPLDVLETLALDADFTVRAAVASHCKLSLEIYQLLVNDTDSTVRAALARNVHAPSETLLALAQDARQEVRVALARNPRLPAEGFSLLFQEESAAVRQSLASNPSLPLSLLEQLAADPSPSIRWSLAANPRAPAELLESWLQEEIGGDGPPVVVQKLLSPLRKTNEPRDKTLLTALARNPRATPALLTRLAEYHSGKAKALVELRAAVAAHKHTPVEILRKLAGHTDLAIRRSLAVNPHTPLDVLQQLLATDDAELLIRIAHHSAVIGSQRRILVDLLMQKISQSPVWSGAPAWFIYQHTELPQVHLSGMLNATSWRDRYVVARHPKATQEMLTALARDGNRFVRAAARTALIKRAQSTKRLRTKKEV
jgi:hypothetical protein